MDGSLDSCFRVLGVIKALFFDEVNTSYLLIKFVFQIKTLFREIKDLLKAIGLLGVHKCLIYQ
jgi:hypothetical protein